MNNPIKNICVTIEVLSFVVGMILLIIGTINSYHDLIIKGIVGMVVFVLSVVVEECIEW